MKTIKHWCALIEAFLFCLLFLIGCVSTGTANDASEFLTEELYTKEDFEAIKVGESTYYDVYRIAQPETMRVTSYGGFCEFPTPSGGTIRIKFYGESLIVGDIEEISTGDGFA